ncbi:D-alanyl-D-alanine carboxypeptidase family protein [Anaerolentibacter hominis]|uniref:D-alanyl-D-alanine carboxypeptidase family protein n=1 Tax=Anaerolentibacter hominis TaxID=3079009 RepID=UPI0031B83F3A
MKKKNHFIHISMFLLFCLLISFLAPGTVRAAGPDVPIDSSDYVWEAGPKIQGKSGIIMDSSTGAVLYEKNPDKVLYPASLTKIMTALLALENASLSEKVTFSEDAIRKTEGSSIGIKIGETITMEECLYGLMLESANAVAYAIAEHIAGSVEAFAQMMNDRAAELGCTNTNFTNPHGLHDENHYTTAHDLALISQAALKNSMFRTIVSTQTYIIPETEMTNEVRHLNNHHQMLYPNNFPQYKYDACIGGKTGYTQASGYSLATFAKKDGMQLICIILKSKSPYEKKNEYTDTISLLDYCFENFSQEPVSSFQKNLASSSLNLFSKYTSLFDSTDSLLNLSGDGLVTLPKNATADQIEETLNVYPSPQTENGQNIVGTVTYSLGGRVLGQADVTFRPQQTYQLISSEAPATPVIEPKKELKDVFTRPVRIALLVVGILFVIILLLLLYNRLVILPRRRRLSSRARHFHSSSGYQRRSGHRRRY